MRAYKGGPIVRTALQLAPMLFQRPGELRGAAWAEIDLGAALWTIPPARMKRGKDGKENGDPHLVPLPRQAVQALQETATPAIARWCSLACETTPARCRRTQCVPP